MSSAPRGRVKAGGSLYARILVLAAAIGVITAIIGVYITKARVGEPGLVTINRSFYISAVISAILSGVAAFTFRHDVSGRINVLYRRADGNIGWLDIGADERQGTNGSGTALQA